MGFLSRKIWSLLCLAWVAIALLKSLLVAVSSNGWQESTWKSSSIGKFRSGSCSVPFLRPNAAEEADTNDNDVVWWPDTYLHIWEVPKFWFWWFLRICICICCCFCSSSSAVNFEELCEPLDKNWSNCSALSISKLGILHSLLRPLVISCKNGNYHKSK